MRINTLGAALAALFLSTPVAALSDAELGAVLQQRIHADRTGACLAAAVIAEQTARAIVCADPADPRQRQLGPETLFEIGSVSKTMTGLLLAMLIAEGKLALDDPLAEHLKSRQVPSYEGSPIRLRHLLTHTSGLPALAPDWPIRHADNPYAALRERDIVGALSRLRLAQAPGQSFAYSNWGSMLLAAALARRAGSDYEHLIQQRIFEPLGMHHARVDRPAEDVAQARGHLSTGARTRHWDFPGSAAGAGGVRASLNDMLRYVEAQLGRSISAASAAIAASHQVVSGEQGPRMGMGWMIAPLHGQDVYFHEGGTGGFSAFVAFDPARQRGVVVLADTALTNLGGLGSVGLHLLDSRTPLGQPRLPIEADAALMDALVGSYRLANGLRMEVRRKGARLEVQAQGQAAFAMAQDSAGEFYALSFDAVLRPQLKEGQAAGFLWLQGGGALPASRIDAAPPAPVLDAQQLADFVGRYALLPGFSIRVTVENGTLHAQGTGQPAFALTAAAEDAFRADQHGVELAFTRDAAGRVDGLVLKQGGRSHRGVRDE